MNSKIIFISPPYERVQPGYDFVRHMASQVPSLGLLHLASMARAHGFDASIIESDAFQMSIEDVAAQVIREKPAYVGITLFTVGVWAAAGVARLIKATLPQTKILVGGPHIASMGRETLERFGEFDLAVLGEGEKTLMALLEALEAGTDLQAVQGILFRRGEAVLQTAPRVSQVVLDDLPLPAWDLLPNFPNAYEPAVFDYPKGPVATLVASRGCPFHCKFCDTSTFGAKVLHYSPQRVFEMMKHLQDNYGVQHVMFVDDLFLASRQRATELCQLILHHGLKITWSCAARVDTVRPELLHLMKKAGCWEISFGLETGSDDLLKKMDKLACVKESEQALQWTHEAGIRAKGLFMLGYPGETPQTVALTKAFVRRIPMQMMNLTKFTPYPGSPVYRELYGTNIRDDHWEKMNGMNFVWAPEGWKNDDLDREYQRVLMAFYSRHRVMLHFMKQCFSYPRHLLRVGKFLAGYTRAKLQSFLAGRGGLLIAGGEAQL